MPQPPSAQIIQKVRKLAEIAEALRQGKDFPVTRLTTIKSLCGDAGSRSSLRPVPRRENPGQDATREEPGRYRELVDRAVEELKPYVTDPTEGGKERLASLCREMEAEQDEHKKIGWNTVRMLKSMDLVVVEECLKSVIGGSESSIWAYHAARDYAERYEARYGSGLIPSSAPMVEEIAGFWRKYHGIEG